MSAVSMADWHRQYEARQANRERLYRDVGKHNRNVVLECLRSLGITRAVINFDGGGDDGQIQSVECEGLVKDLEKVDVNVVLNTIREEFHEGQWTEQVTETTPTNVRLLLENFAYTLLSSTGYDWVNNEGGYGEFVIDPFEENEEGEQGGIHLDLSLRVTTSEDHEFDF